MREILAKSTQILHEVRSTISPSAPCCLGHPFQWQILQTCARLLENLFTMTAQSIARPEACGAYSHLDHSCQFRPGPLWKLGASSQCGLVEPGSGQVLEERQTAWPWHPLRGCAGRSDSARIISIT